jgi:stage IV sporulation protein A
VTAQLMIRLQLETAAEEELKRAIGKDGSLPQAHLLLGQLALFRGQFDESIAQTKRELAIAPASAPAYYQLGDAYVRQSRWDDGIAALLQDLLFAFPMAQLQVYLPRWLDALDDDNPLRQSICAELLERAKSIHTLGQAEPELQKLQELPQVQQISLDRIDLGTGTLHCWVRLPDRLYYETLSAKTGTQIRNDAELMQMLTDLIRIKADYDKISDALAAVRTTGYGVVMPGAEEMKMEKPEILKRGSAYGVNLKAGAPSIHMIRVDIDTEINPIVGDEKQSRDLIAYLSGEEPEKLWESNIFGKSVYDLIREGLNAKLLRTPEEVQHKFRGSLSRIINEGASGLICIIL